MIRRNRQGAAFDRHVSISKHGNTFTRRIQGTAALNGQAEHITDCDRSIATTDGIGAFQIHCQILHCQYTEIIAVVVVVIALVVEIMKGQNAVFVVGVVVGRLGGGGCGCALGQVLTVLHHHTGNRYIFQCPGVGAGVAFCLEIGGVCVRGLFYDAAFQIVAASIGALPPVMGVIVAVVIGAAGGRIGVERDGVIVHDQLFVGGSIRIGVFFPLAASVSDGLLAAGDDQVTDILAEIGWEQYFIGIGNHSFHIRAIDDHGFGCITHQ